MRFYGKAETAAAEIVRLFERGEVPGALAQVFLTIDENKPCATWSWSNQLMAALFGRGDARGYRQWLEVGRYVRKGERSFPILIPIIKKRTERDPETGDETERTRCVGFKAAAVFGIQQTEGEPLPVDQQTQRVIEALPLVDVARRWEIEIGTYTGREGGALGKYRFGPSHKAIALGVENLATWAHELVHAAEHRLGRLSSKTTDAQRRAEEVVAELGGATVLRLLGYEQEADLGGAYEYIKAWSRKDPALAAMHLVNRTAQAVALILETADETPADGAQDAAA